jgi:hypothetical protein
MTWSVLGSQVGYVHVGADGITNAYSGDTTVDQYRSLLCVNVDYRPAPSTISFDFYNGWVRGALAATSPIEGWRLTSQSRGDQICAASFGSGWRMAEFHDGYYGQNFAYSGGWSYWGQGSIPSGTRFWTAINDQPANPWNSYGVPSSAAEILGTIDGPTLMQLSRYATEEEVSAFLEPVADQVADYALNTYGEDIREDLVGYPEAALVLAMFYFGREHGIQPEDFDGGGGCSAKLRTNFASPGDCFMAALHSVMGIDDIRHLYADFMHGVSARTIIGAVKQMGKRVWWSVSIVIAVYDLGDCLGWW